MGLGNPLTSRSFILPGYLRELGRADVDATRVDFCSFGTRWRKGTKLMTYDFDVTDLKRHVCHNKKICLDSGCEHQQLSGVAPGGRWWTMVAQPYPTRLCTKVAKCIVSKCGPLVKLREMW